MVFVQKNKFVKIDYINITILSLLYLIVVFLITHGENMYGSATDWSVQHWAIPEYFRTLFYDTHNLFSQFAANLGGGQNIFYFAYYGFLSPIILLSYLFPGVEMFDYITITSIVGGIVSVILFYKWLKNHNYSSFVCLFISCLFLCAGPLIFHGHRHIMFVNYMPFLILGLMGVDKHFNEGKSYLLIISIFLVIMTSYFYSVGAILCISLYAIYLFLKVNDNINFKLFFKEAFRFAVPIIIGVMMACVLLLPVFNALTSGRGHGVVPISSLKLIIPHINLEYILYSPYSIGLTAIVIIALFTNLIIKGKASKFFNISLICLFTLNIFVYILNGKLYLDGKVLIPFLPLYCLAIAGFIDNVFNNKIQFNDILFVFGLTLILTILLSNKGFTILYFIDGLFTLFLISRYYKNGNKFIFVPLMILAFAICLLVNSGDKLITIEEHNRQNDERIAELVKDIEVNDSGYYRIYTNLSGNENINRVLSARENILSLYSSTYNKFYNKFFYHEFNNNLKYRNSVMTHENKNVMFESYMGVKYLITDKKAPMGYKFLKQNGDYKLYVNENTLPVGYASDSIISEEQYKEFSYPGNLDVLMNNIVVSKAPFNSVHSNMKKYNLLMNSYEISNLKIKQVGNDYHIKTKGDVNNYIKFNLKDEIKDKLLLIRLHISKPQSCVKGDLAITINGIKNKLTCKEWKYYNNNKNFDYLLSSDSGIDNIKINFSKGEYIIDDIQLFTLDYEHISNLKDKVDPFVVKEAKDNIIKGNINVKNDGYFKLSIPYDKGFKIKVDGKDTEYELVNKAFIGFKISKGYHNIEIEYQAPLFSVGKIISILGLLLFIIVCIYQKFRVRKNVIES